MGLDQYEGRRYQGLKRHLIFSAVSYLFLAGCGRNSGGKNPELTECQVHTAIAASIPFWWLGKRPSREAMERTLEKIWSGAAETQWQASATPRGLSAHDGDSVLPQSNLEERSVRVSIT